MARRLTEQQLVHRPVVYGFLRLVNVPKARQVALRESLAEYCEQHELALYGVFMERSKLPVEGGSAAFTGLLDVLGMPGAYGVVAPTYTHLGVRPVAAERARHLAAIGSRLILVRGQASAQARGGALRSADAGP